MDQFEREDSSTYVDPEQRQSAEPVREEPAQPPLQEAPKPKKSKAPLILTLLLLLALVAAATLGWMWYQQNGRVDDLEADLSSARNKVSQLESSAKAEEALDDSEVMTDTTDTDSEAAIKAALAYMQAPTTPLTGQQAKVEYLKGNFAKVIVSTGQAGSGAPSFAVTLKKSTGQWVVLSAAEGPVANKDELKKTYGIPEEAF